jgi:DNA polymerase family B
MTASECFSLFPLAALQVATQPAMEAMPLVMEPESRFYAAPVVVLDFQSVSG